ncbi:MAG: ribonuclease catalytic domain-containing protein [Deltaproteobacteria bacterium]
MTVSKLPSQNELILFRKRKEPSLGIFAGAVNDKVSVFSEEGKEISIDLQKIAFSSGIKIEGEHTQSEKKLKLREMRRHLEEKKDEVDLVIIWECIQDTEDEIMFEDMKELYFGDKEVKDDDALVLFWAVDKNEEYFRRGESGYEPRTREEAEDIIRKKEAEEKRKEQREQALYWAKGVISGTTQKQYDGFDPAECINMIREYIIHLDKYNRAGEVKSLLSEVGVRDVEGAVEFLIRAGGWEEDEDPVLKRLSIREDFPDSVESETDRIMDEPLPREGFEDLRDLEIFSIDDENTEDIDDALSVTSTPEGLLVGIHIANVAAFVPKWSDTDEEAARRGETIYLPEKRIHMFPPRLITGKLSLTQKTQRASLSLLILFDEELNIKSHRFTNSIIRVRGNLSYPEGTDYFLSDPEGIKLREIALELRRRRLEAGALIVQLPQLKIGITEDGEITVWKNYMNSEAHVVVAEMMILMNRMAGNYLREREIPGIYRSQPEAVSEEARSYDATDPLYPVRIVRFMRAPRVGLNPEPHKSLGLDVYTQATSPIRRYTDLIIQRQIVSDLLYGDTAYTEDELENLYPRVEIGVRDKKTVQRQREKYWLYKYLKTLEGGVIEGIISSVPDTRASVYLPDYLFETTVNPGSDAALEEGKSVKLLVQKVDPLRRTLRLAVVPS